MIRTICFLAIALTGCNAQDDCAQAAEFPATMKLGVGEKAFKAIKEGDNLELDYGNQGGSHVWIALETRGVAPGANLVVGDDMRGPNIDVYLSYDGMELGYGTSRGQVLKGNGEQAELTGLQLGLGWIEEAENSAIDWGALTLDAELEDQCGVTVTSSALVSLDRYGR